MPGADRDAGLVEQPRQNANESSVRCADVGVDVERAVGGRQPVDPEPGQPVEQQPAVVGVARDVPSHSAYDASVNAATAACWDSAGGQIVKLPVSTSTGGAGRSGTSIQPIRQPVIEKYFENELNTTACGTSPRPSVLRGVA